MSIRQSHHAPRHVNFFAPQPRLALYRRIAYSFVGLTILIVISALWLSSVRARITILMKRDVTRIETVVDVSAAPVLGELGGRIVKGTFGKIQEFPVKTDSTIEGKASGTVKISNKYSKPQTLVEKTRLLSADGRLYRIDKTIVIPSNQSVTVTAHADVYGSKYALEKDVKLTIPGLWIDLQKWIYAETMTPFSTTVNVTRVVSDTDLTAAYATLEETVIADAEKTLKAEAGVNEGWGVLLEKKVLEKKTNVSSGQNTESFLTSVKMDVTAVYYPMKEIEVLIRHKLGERLSVEREIIEFSPARSSFILDQIDVKGQKARIRIAAQAMTRLTEKSPQFAKSNILGLSEADVRAKLSAIEGVDRVEIRIRPSWIHTIPKNSSHVELIVQ